MEAAEHLTAPQRSMAKSDAIKSACWGSLSSVMIQDSAIIILFATILGAGDMLSMITTSTQGIASCILLIPAAYLSGKLGYKKAVMFSKCMTAYSAAWFPLLLSKNLNFIR